MSRPLLENLHELGARIGSAKRTILFLDFDGTLVPIVRDPGEARLAPGTRLVLEKLSRQRDLLVAVVSGRSLRDLSARVGLPGIVYAGNHGLEIEGKSMSFLEPTAVRMRPMLGAQAEVLRKSLSNIHGVQIEDKGLTLSVHYRNVPANLQKTVEEVVREKVRKGGKFRLTEGKKVMEVRPPVSWHKGEAVCWIQKQVEAPALSIYIGDDSTDEDAFLALPDGVTIRVGGNVNSLAGYSVANPDEVRLFLTWLLI
jgi:trehalose 6-phosphate phosphatase